MSFDSAYAWWQARGGESTDIVAPAMIHAWRACEWIASGPGPAYSVHLALFWSGLALLAGTLPRGRTAQFATMCLPAFVPVSMLLRAHVWTDVALAASLVAATGLLAQAHASRARGWLVPALVLLAYASLLRHNALPAVLPLLAWWAWLLLHGARAASPRAVVVLVVAVSLCLFGTGRWLARQVDRQVPVWPSLAQFDLAAISIETGRMQLPAFMIGSGLDLPELALAFRPWSNLPMLTGTRHGMRAPFDPPLTPDELARLRTAWIDAVVDHPAAWLAHRWRVSRALFGTHAPDWPIALIVVDAEYAYRDNPPVARNEGRLHAALMRAANAGASTPALAAWPCLLAGLLVLPGAWRRRRERACGQLPLLLLASAWAYALPLCVLAPSAELRYLDWPCLASLIAFACVAFAPRTRHAARLDPETHAKDRRDEHRATLHVQHR